MELSDLIVRILVAAALGGLIGLEREYRDKSAGFRTMILISVGAALFSIIAQLYFEVNADTDPTRIMSYILSGIGFLGAGVIIKDGSSVKGLTTASTIWMSAALGLGAGAGFFEISIFTAALVMAVLIVLPPLEHWIDSRHEFRAYDIQLKAKGDLSKLMKLFEKNGVTIFRYRRKMIDGAHWVRIRADGSPDQHHELTDSLADCGFVKSF